jgi:hypothetical protein
MAASLSCPQPANPRKQQLNSARLNPLANNLMMSMTLLRARSIGSFTGAFRRGIKMSIGAQK